MSYNMAIEDLDEDYQVTADFPPSMDEYQKTSRLRRDRGHKQKTQKHNKHAGKSLRGKSVDVMYIDDGWWN